MTQPDHLRLAAAHVLRAKPMPSAPKKVHDAWLRLFKATENALRANAISAIDLRELVAQGLALPIYYQATAEELGQP
jgi:hypothetical protein